MTKRIIYNVGLIFNNFGHLSDENCPLAAVNASHFLPCHFSNQLNSRKVLKNVKKSLS